MVLARDPKVLLLDEPLAGMSPTETHATVELIQRIAADPERTVLLVEHDMDVVLAISATITVMQTGQVLAIGHARRNSPQRGRQKSVPRRARVVSQCCSNSTTVNAYYGKSHVLQDVSLERRRRRSRGAARAATAAAARPRSSRSWASSTSRGGTIALSRAKPIANHSPFSLAKIGIAYVPEERRIFPNLTVGENLRLAALHGQQRRLDREADLRVFRRARRAQELAGEALGRRTADARDRARTDRQPGDHPARRADGRSRAADRPQRRRHRARDQERGPHDFAGRAKRAGRDEPLRPRLHPQPRPRDGPGAIEELRADEEAMHRYLAV